MSFEEQIQVLNQRLENEVFPITGGSRTINKFPNPVTPKQAVKVFQLENFLDQSIDKLENQIKLREQLKVQSSVKTPTFTPRVDGGGILVQDPLKIVKDNPLIIGVAALLFLI